MNTSVAQMLANDTDRQIVLQQIYERQDEMVEEISRMNTKMNTLVEMLDCVVTQNRLLQLRLNELLTQQGVPLAPIPTMPNERQQQIVDNALQRHQQRIGASQTANPQATVNGTARNSPNIAMANPPTVTPAVAPPPPVPGPAIANPPNRRLAANRPVPGLANVLQRHRVGNAAKGVKNPEHALEKILMKLYQLPSKTGFASITTESGRLEDRDQKVMEQCFTNLSGNNKRQAKQKVTKILSMVDGFWTKEERDDVVNYRLSNTQALSLFKDISKRVQKFCWTVKTLREYHSKGKLPKERKPGVRVSTQIQGLGNMVGDLNFGMYVPNYNVPGHPRQSAKSLPDFAESKTEELMELFDRRDNRNRYQNNN